MSARADNIIRLPLLKDDEFVLVRPGIYHAVYEGHLGVDIFKTKKLKVLFRLIEHAELVLPRWYRVPGYKPRVSARARSDIVREFSAVLGRRIRHDRIPLEALANVVIIVEVKTVTRDQRQKELVAVNQYSVIASLKGCA